MTPLRQPLRRCIVALSLVLGACGSGNEFHPPAMYTAAQLNAAALPGLPEEDPASPTPVARPSYGQSGSQPSDPPTSTLRVIHASPDRAATPVDVYIAGAATPIATAVAYRSITGAVTYPSGEHTVQLRRAGADAAAAPLLSATTPTLAPGQRYTLIAHGVGGAAAPHALALAADADASPTPEAGTAHVRFFHAVVGLGTVDICRPGTPARPAAAGQPARPATLPSAVLGDVAYGSFASATHDGETSHYVHVPAGSPLTLQIRAHAARPCAGLLRGTVTLTPADQSVVTAVAVGRTTAPLAPRALLVCPDGATDGAPTCASVAIR